MASGPPDDGSDAGDPPLATVREVVARTHERDGPALVAPERATDYSAREFATSVRKAANLFSHYGVDVGRPIAVAVGPKDPVGDAEPGWLGTTADPLLAILGGMTLGVPVELAADPAEPVQAPVLVAPTAWLDRYEVSPGTSVVAYGGPPEDPSVTHFERERWSENPTEPPESLDAGRVAFRGDGVVYAHADLVDAAARLADERMRDADRIRVATRVDAPAVLVAGVLAPLLAGVPIRPVPGAWQGGVEKGVFVVSGEERHVISLDDVY